jgi:hypothetical protein
LAATNVATGKARPGQLSVRFTPEANTIRLTRLCRTRLPYSGTNIATVDRPCIVAPLKKPPKNTSQVAKYFC